jgi:ABC-type cobalamin/Fe3+-siderophores transport system ATPase subunit
MCENIALIKEVHENIPVSEANRFALNILKKIDLEEIAYKYVSNCTDKEIFLVMFIRAVMSQEKNVILESPSKILGNLFSIKKLIENMIELDSSKKIIILDLVSNENYYKGAKCRIEKLN